MAFLKNKTSVRPLRGRLYKIADRHIAPGQTVEVPDHVVERLRAKNSPVLTDLEVVDGPASDPLADEGAPPEAPTEEERIAASAVPVRSPSRRRATS